MKTNLAGSGAAGFAGNVLLGGVVGMGVDAATGATLEHTPNPVNATLRPLRGAKPTTPRRDRRKPQPPVAAAPQAAPAAPDVESPQPSDS